MVEKLETKSKECDCKVICKELCNILRGEESNSDYTKCPVYHEYMEQDIERDTFRASYSPSFNK